MVLTSITDIDNLKNETVHKQILDTSIFLMSINLLGGGGFCEPNNTEVLLQFYLFCLPHSTKMDKAAVFLDGLRKRNKSEEDEVELMDEDGA